MAVSQRQALEELLDAGDELARAVVAAMPSVDDKLCQCDVCRARRDWSELRRRYAREIDRIVSR